MLSRIRGVALMPSLVLVACFGLLSCTTTPTETSEGGRFTLVMVPDTQNYVDYTHQKAEGFALDAAELFVEQMSWIAAQAPANGGDVAFVASVGDTWQHPTQWIDPEHVARGIGRVDNPFFAGHFDPTDQVIEVEVPKAIEGYELVAAAGIPFGVPPGNHDYDAMFNVDRYPPNLSKPPEEFSWEDLGVLHVGGLENFLSAFGEETPFFADQDWYVDAYGGGTSSAQIFEAGGYRFLHVALEMQAGDVLFLTNMTPHATFDNVSSTTRWSMDLRYAPIGVPNNVDEAPESYTPERTPNSMACAPTEADFVIRDTANPERDVVDGGAFAEIRMRYARQHVHPGRGWTHIRERRQ